MCLLPNSWNSLNKDEEPIVMPMDFTDDIEWRKNTPTKMRLSSLNDDHATALIMGLYTL